jgi:hypothetical protein
MTDSAMSNSAAKLTKIVCNIVEMHTVKSSAQKAAIAPPIECPVTVTLSSLLSC